MKRFPHAPLSRSSLRVYASTLLFVGLAILIGMSGTTEGRQLSLQEQFGQQGSADTSDPVTLTSDFKVKTGTRLGILRLHAKIADKYHLYSVTQPPGGPLRSVIDVTPSDDYEVIGEFTPDTKPHVDEDNDFGVPVESHEHEVVWSAPIQLAPGVDPEKLKIEIVFNGQTCATDENGNTVGCIPLNNIKVPSKFSGYDDSLQVSEPPPAEPVKKFQAKRSHALWSGQIRRADGKKKPIRPGDKIVLELTGEPTDGYHLYAYEKEKKSIVASTLIALTETSGLEPGPVIASPNPEPEEETPGIHHAPVTWSLAMTVPDDFKESSLRLEGLIGFGTCTKAGCDPPTSVHFSATVPVGKGRPPFPVHFEEGTSYGEVEKAIKNPGEKATPVKSNNGPKETVAAFDSQERDIYTPEEIAEMAQEYDPDEKVVYLTLDELDDHPVGTNSQGIVHKHKTTLWTAMIGAFFGGMLLNLMPCVFPVLGLKIMGFVEQAGNDPKKIRMHGIVFALGLLVSMWGLAAIILTLKYTLGQDVIWGQQMANPYFVASMIVLLFLLGLNMAGVFEIGTSLTRVGGGKPRKGYSASFLSGILTTLIATPCSGPFLGAAMAYTLVQPPHIAMLLFTVFAVGIAFPYLLLSFFPALINRLPRPGAWMETFKVIMAFLLFATVAFFMQAFGGQTGVKGLSWLVMALVVIALAAYFYGRWSAPSVKQHKRILFGLIMPALIAALGGWMVYDAAAQESSAIAQYNAGGFHWHQWQPGIVKHILKKKKRIVWVDYTADW